MGYIGSGPTRFNTADELTVTGDAQIDGTTLVVDSTNNRVGVNTASPATALDVTGTVTADGLTVDTNTLYVDSTNNRVGIGTTSPTFGSGNGLEIEQAGATTLRLENSTDSNSFEMGATSSAVSLYGYNNFPMVFATNNSERMRIDSSGNVGIGSTSPQSVLDLGDGTAGKGIVWGGPTGTAHYSSIWSEYGTGSIVIGAGLKGSTSSSDFIYPYTGTYGYAAIELDNFSDDGIKFYTAADAARTAGTSATKNERMRIDTSGNLLVGTTSTFGSLAGITSASNFVVGSSSQYWKTTNFSSTYYFNFNGSDKATISGSNGAYTALSDRNKKKDFEESTLGLSEVLRLQPTMFRMSSDDASAPLQLGFIAQDVADVIPQAYVEQEAPDGTFIGLQDRPIIAVLTKAIQEQQETITALEARIAALEAN